MSGVFPEILFDALPSALKWKEVASNAHSTREGPMVYSFDAVSPSTATCIAKTKPLSTFVVQNFRHTHTINTYIHTHTQTHTHTHTYIRIYSERNAGSSLSHHKFTVLSRELGRYSSVQHGFEQGRGRSFLYVRTSFITKVFPNCRSGSASLTKTNEPETSLHRFLSPAARCPLLFHLNFSTYKEVIAVSNLFQGSNTCCCIPF